jgi:Bacterial transcriptional activator domain
MRGKSKGGRSSPLGDARPDRGDDLGRDVSDAVGRPSRAGPRRRARRRSSPPGRHPVTAGYDVGAGELLHRFLLGQEGQQQRRQQAETLYRCTVGLATAWCRLGDHGLAAVIAESAIGLDPLREVGHRALIEAELARGDRAAAARAFGRCEEILRRELGVSPSPETAVLSDGIRP